MTDTLTSQNIDLFSWDTLYNQYNTQLLNLSLCCNCTAMCAMSSFTELYSHASWVFTTFHHSSPNSM
jgi:hypothetical protein